MTYVVNRVKLQIEWGHCDPAGIVFNSRFFEFFDSATWLYFQTVLNVPRHLLAEHFGILAIPLVEAGATFNAPLKFGDEAVHETTIAEFRRSSFDVRHRIVKSGEVAVEGLEKRVWAGTDPQDPSRMRAVTLPAELTARFQAK